MLRILQSSSALEERDCVPRYLPYLGRVNFGKLLLVGLLLIGGGCSISQIKAERSIQITIFGVPAEEKAKIDAVYPVSKEGMVNLPFIGKINAAGKNPEKLARDIEKAYVDAEIYPNPTIGVIDEVGCLLRGDPVVHIGGQVQKPGPIDFAEGMTLGDAIKAAGGATEFGNLKRGKLYRDGKMTAYDLGKEENLAVPLKQNDTIEVPQKNFYGQ